MIDVGILPDDWTNQTLYDLLEDKVGCKCRIYSTYMRLNTHVIYVELEDYITHHMAQEIVEKLKTVHEVSHAYIAQDKEINPPYDKYGNLLSEGDTILYTTINPLKIHVKNTVSIGVVEKIHPTQNSYYCNPLGVALDVQNIDTKQIVRVINSRGCIALYKHGELLSVHNKHTQVQFYDKE